MAIPIIAFTSAPRATATLAGSPPEVVNLIPLMIIKITAAMPATQDIMVITTLIMLITGFEGDPGFTLLTSEQKGVAFSVELHWGTILTAALASTGKVNGKSKLNNKDKLNNNFFIYVPLFTVFSANATRASAVIAISNPTTA